MTGVIREVGEGRGLHYMVYIDREHPDPVKRVCKAEGARLRRWCKKNAPSLIPGHGIMATGSLPMPQIYPENAEPGVTYYGTGEKGQFWLIRVRDYLDAFKIVMWKS